VTVPKIESAADQPGRGIRRKGGQAPSAVAGCEAFASQALQNDA
jgi:hypothetical protein